MSNQAPYSLSAASQALANFSAGEDAIVTGFLGGRNLQGRLLALGLFPGQRVTVCQNHGNSLVVGLNGHKIALGRGVSLKILAMPAGRCRRQEDDCCCRLPAHPATPEVDP